MAKKKGIADLDKLLAFASKDETRYSINGIYFDKDLPYSVTTDGHRLYATKSFHSQDRVGQIANAKAFEDTLQVLKVDFEYPNWKQVVPTQSVLHSCTLNVPDYLIRLKHLRDSVKATICFDDNSAWIELGGPNGNVRDNAHTVGIDLTLLSPFAGDTIKIHFAEHESNPMIVTESNVELSRMSQVFGLDWFAVIMPMRLVDAIVVNTTIAACTETMPSNVVKIGARS